MTGGGGGLRFVWRFRRSGSSQARQWAAAAIVQDPDYVVAI